MIMPTLERVALLQKGREVRFERHLRQSPSEVWDALTDPDKVRTWFATVDGEFREGNQVTLRFDTSSKSVVNATVRHARRPSLLEYSWDSQQVPDAAPAARGGGTCGGLLDLRGTRIRFEINAAAGGGTDLVLKHVLSSTPAVRRASRGGLPPPTTKPEQVLASWANSLDTLTASLTPPARRGAARAADGSWPFDRYHDLLAKFSEAVD
jgi:uncharacterized protein YndB with AHSA1/START domain